eukprot:CAMPEP_0177647638 /NCGR_PEP_ID=MMETSP0447-20121125/10406_1 /TAXON_ID=0 /ORGANISM="Stygamoeba regulata, Strain BSH-02190019" /LENGTH=128 /DNA_ID=CAMNT_0019150235 /DNA_START=185 /DNA_END=571 /DNA_ORIENTATION=-
MSRGPETKQKPNLLAALHHVLHDLLLLGEESTNDALTNAATAAVATVGARHALLALGHVSGLAGAEVGNTVNLTSAVTALDTLDKLLLVLVGESSTGGLHNLDEVGPGVVAVTTTISKPLDHLECLLE